MLSFYLIVCGIVSYFIGNVNWAIIISKRNHKDIRNMGSGNPGSLNMGRNLGLKFGLMTFFLDMLKGAVPSLCVFFIFRGIRFPGSEFMVSDFAVYLCGFCAVMGHIYPALLKFKGGKGIASTIGVMIVSNSVYGIGWASVVIMALVAALVFIYFTEFGAMGSFIAITPPAISGSIRLFLQYEQFHDSATAAFTIVTNMLIFAICFFTWFAHRKNIERMLAGEEHPTSIKGMVVKARAKKLAQKAAAENKSVNTETDNYNTETNKYNYKDSYNNKK